MRVRLLGGFDVEGIAERDLGSRKARTLLKLLAVRRGAPTSADAIAEVLWGGEQPARPSDQVGVLVSRLRGVLGAERIRRSDAGYTLVVDWLDVDEVETLTAAAAEALADGRIGAARAASQAALGLLSGPLLGDEEGDWIEPARASAAAAASRLRGVALDVAVTAGDTDAVVAIGESSLAADPYDEVALRALMVAHLRARRPGAALAAYARVRRALADDLGVPPTAETEALHAQALAAADGDAGAPEPPPSPPEPTRRLTGRERQLRDLDESYAAVLRGEARLVVVVGEAGMGKTTLVRTWLAGARGALVLSGRCDELGRDLPLQPLADALADHLRRAGPEQGAETLGGDATILAPLLGPVAGHAGRGATAVVDPEEGRAQVFSALLGALTRAADGRPLVVVVEDLHLAAPATIGWLAFAERRATTTLLVATCRPPSPRLAASKLVEVGPLTAKDVRELTSPDRAAELVDRTGGHPLLLRAFLDAETGAGVPANLEAAVGAQLAAMGPDAARTIRAAAVLGTDCDVDLVAVVMGLSAVEVLAHLESAARTGLVVEQGSGFGFRHELLREAVNAQSRPAQLAALHRGAAEALVRRPQADPLAVAVHARSGGDRELATTWFVAAAEAAAARFDLDASDRHLAAAVEQSPHRPDPYVARARMRMSRADLAGAAGDAATAIERGGGSAAFEVAGWVAYYRRDYPAAKVYADEALARAGDDSTIRVSAAALAGRVRHGAGDLRGAISHLEDPGPAPLAVRGVADVWLAQARLHEGRPADALAALARPLLAPDSLAHPWAPLHLRFCHALALGQRGDVSAALAAVEGLDAAIARGGVVGARFVAPAHNVASWILRWTGCPAEADERNMAAVEATGGEAGPRSEAFAEGHYVALLDLTDGALLRDDHERASSLVERLAVLDGWNGTMSWHQRHRLGLFRARLAAAGGDTDLAIALATAVADDAAQRGATRYELLARALAGVLDPSVAVARLEPVVEGLARCAALDGWWLVGALARSRGLDAWRHLAEEGAHRMVAEVERAGGQVRDARRLAGRLLDAGFRA